MAALIIAKEESSNPQDYYDEMVGETFAGTYNGKQKLTSVDWIKIKYQEENLPTKMKKAIKDIIKKYGSDENIWRGISDNNLYCKCDSTETELKKASKFKIEKVKSFTFQKKDWREKKYKDKKGFYFVIKIAE